MDVAIRPPRADELDALAAIEDAADARFRERFPGLDWPSAPSGRERAAQGLLLVAVSDGAPIGFAHVLEEDGDAHLEQIAVLPAHGGRGAGAALLRAAATAAAGRGAARMTLRTFADVPWNAPFYAAHGFTESEPTGAVQLRHLAADRAAGLERWGRRVQMTALLPLDRPATVAAVLAVARRAAERVLTSGELSTAAIDVVDASDSRAVLAGAEPVLDPADVLPHDHWDLQVRIVVHGERGGSWLSPRESEAELLERIASDLQDFVATSGFGWGQQR